MPEHRAIQRAFAAHLRDPERQPPPVDVEDRRMAIYRRLFYNNIQGFLAQAFPVLRTLLSDQRWHALVRRFYAEHRCRRPQFYQLAEEFLEFLQAIDGEGLPPFALELAHYEWIELVLAIDPVQPVAHVAIAHWHDELRLVLNPWLRLLSYRWPVHKIAPDYQPAEPPSEPSHLLVFRKPDEAVGFRAINALSARLLALLQQDPAASLHAVLHQLAEEAGLPQAALQPHALQTLQALQRDGVILGAQPAD